MHDPVNHPQHYTSHPSGVECLDIVEHMPFSIGSAFKYVWRLGLKTPDPLLDIGKAGFYVDRQESISSRLAVDVGSLVERVVRAEVDPVRAHALRSIYLHDFTEARRALEHMKQHAS